MEVAPFFVDFHHFLSIFTIFYRFSRFTHFCRDLHFVAIYALFPQIFFGRSSLLRNITRFLHVWAEGAEGAEGAERAEGAKGVEGAEEVEGDEGGEGGEGDDVHLVVGIGHLGS